MAELAPALQIIFKLEGGFSNIKADKGKTTNFGISLTFLKRINPLANEDMIKNLTKETAAALYKQEFWDKYDFGKIVNQDVANLVMNLAVNVGPNTAIRFIQKGMRAVNGQILIDDGFLGPVTLTAINITNSVSLLVAIKCFADVYYRGLNSAEFLNGWLNRLYAV